jgi:hypothetical protein
VSTSEQSLIDSVAADIAKSVGTSLKARPDLLTAISQFTPSQEPKLASLGKDFAVQVIGNWWSTKQGGKRGKLTREEVTEAAIEWFSSEISEEISDQLVNYTISSVTKKRLGSSRVEETVDGSVEIDEPLATHMIARFGIEFEGAATMKLDIPVSVSAKFTVNDAITKLLSVPVLRIEEIDLSDCEASVEVSGPLGMSIGEFKIPIKGKVTF